MKHTQQHSDLQQLLSDIHLPDLDVKEEDRDCLACGLHEVQRWQDDGPVAPALSAELLRRVSAHQKTSWLTYTYRIAAAFAILVLFVQVARQGENSSSSDIQEAGHITVDSARNDTAFLLNEDPYEDSVVSVSLIETPQPQAEQSSGVPAKPASILPASMHGEQCDFVAMPAYRLSRPASRRDGELPDALEPFFQNLDVRISSESGTEELS
ncbi:MAG: hypothetical protein NWR72_00750 [Bacteroidia bacterium]|nr:hypothetical protein [Bacteroidia bacterium]